jgi:cytosine/adenosine deaminase-related metal-dependent hydrolase
MFGARPITFVNAAVIAADGQVYSSIRLRRGVVDGLGGAPQRGDILVDLDEAVILPGLINAHDHLELNSFPRLKWRPQYANVREWIADFQPRFASDPALAVARPDTLDDRVWVGGLKNLLSGVTTVCHHNPLHATLGRRFPVRIVRRLGLSHSLHIDGERVAESYRRTPPTWPWIVHAAEGVDSDAQMEIDRLGSLGCLGSNTVLVHGVALDQDRAAQVVTCGGSLIWCPSSNDFLFGKTADVNAFESVQRLAIGTDSRLSGEGDLLDELRAADRTQQLSPQRLVNAVTANAARVLRLEGFGCLAAGQAADLVALRRVRPDPYESVIASTRAEVRLAMIGGEPLVGDQTMRELFSARRQPHALARIDGQLRLLAGWVARRVEKLRLTEPGLELVPSW